VLFLESDRMGHLLGVIDQARLDEQRGVVQNEKRQGENRPYGKQFDLMTKAMYPKGHPYSWTVIGEMDDLNAASLEDVQEWFKSYYGAANAVIAIAGDIEPEDVYQRVLKYFGDIPSGPTIERQEINIPVHGNDTYQEYQDRVPEARITWIWNTPQFGTREDIHFDLIASLLTNGKNSRLYKKLVYEDQTASSVQAFEWSKEISSNFVVQANVKPGQSVDVVKGTMEQVLKEFLASGPTDNELTRVKADYFADFIKGLERIGGFGGKSDILASNEVYFGDVEHYKKVLKYVQDATSSDLLATAKIWLEQGRHQLICYPFPEYTTTASEVDRSKLPEIGEPAAAKFPTIQRATLKNGLNIVLAQRKGVPTVVMDMMIDAGYASDQFAAPGTASLALNLMDEGTKSASSLEISERLQLLGASLSTSSDLDISYISMNTLEQSLDNSLELFADVILNPAFPENEFERLKKEQLAAIQREKAQPVGMALRVITKYMYGEGHAYSLPYTGTGFENTVSELTREDMINFYDRWMKPNNATIVVVGDVEMDYLTNKLKDLFEKWKQGDIPEKNISNVKAPKGNTLYLIDRPESQQSVIMAGHVTNPYGEVSEIGRETMMNILGGEFTSRINMNLREDKHWSYGAFAFIINAKGQRPFITYAPVQTDKTSESIQELKKEVTQFVGNKPATSEEVEKAKTNRVLQLPGQWETNNAVNNSIVTIVKYGLDDDYYQTYDQSVWALSLQDIESLSKTMIHPSELNWFVVGDKEVISEKLEDLGFDEIVELDADGNPLNPTGAIDIEGGN